MKPKLLFTISLILVLFFSSCENNRVEYTEEEKLDIYYNEIINSLDKNIASDIKILTTKAGKENEEIILYSYYNNAYKSKRLVLKSAIFHYYGNVEFFDLSEQNSQDLPISFGSRGGIDNDEKGRMITFGAINDENIKHIKLLYSDDLLIELPIEDEGFIVIRDDFFEGVIEISAYDEDLNEVYKFP